ncbi:nuclear mitotic apparatus protein 1 [Phyllostomus discolor]|uniref:Nuclear mitotic apparatus protein 1 n=1 Tax=Phyllostomus discolor TaxID=89673 RepID=A0A833ZZ25_9CHIR|nr:nuclear mitotic apparatus protein 1 [Phyllostomus discolor]
MLLVEQLVGRELRGEVTGGGQELGAVCLGLFFYGHCAGKTKGREAFCDRKAPAVPDARPVKSLGQSCYISRQLGSTDHCHPMQPSLSLATITDEEMKTGDPQETLRRASMQPTQIAEGTGITTRQRKRVSLEPHQGPGTPETKKPTSCFPRPMTPRDRHEGRKQSTTEAQKKAVPAVVKQDDRRQSTAFNILNTPKKLGNSLLRRGASKKALSKASPNTRSGTRRSPRIATTTASAATAAAIAAATATPRAKGKVEILTGKGEGSTQEAQQEHGAAPGQGQARPVEAGH